MSGTTIFAVRAVEATLHPHRWLWAEAEREAIAAHWERRRAERSGIFNGRVLMVSDHRLEGDVLRARFFETDFANLLAWKEFGFPGDGVVNGFAMGALRAADGAFVLGVMADHTANAGRVYFASGTPDRHDVTAGGRVDLEGSVTRELKEETGLGEADYRVGEGWVIARHRGYMAFLKPLAAVAEGDALRQRLRAHLAAETEPELSDIRVVRSPDEIDEQAMPGFLPDVLRWFFAGGPAQR